MKFFSLPLISVLECWVSKVIKNLVKICILFTPKTNRAEISTPSKKKTRDKKISGEPVNGRHLVLIPDDEEHTVVGQGWLDVAGQQRRSSRHRLHLNGRACNKQRHKFFTCLRGGRGWAYKHKRGGVVRQKMAGKNQQKKEERSLAS
jgi:hypothetical protein